MNTRPVSMITKLWLISILVLALLVWDGVAAGDTALDGQVDQAVKKGNVALVEGPSGQRC